MTPPRSSLSCVLFSLLCCVCLGSGAVSSSAEQLATGAVSPPNAASITITRGSPASVPKPAIGQVIIRPARTPVVLSNELSYTGEPVTVTCSTCHTTRVPNIENGQDGKLPSEFHQGLIYKHGAQSCVSCHNASNYDTLKRADGRQISFPEAKDLCSQCHGPQARDYAAGAHGGMQGSWDLKKGGRVRNTCTDCHDPHAPKIVQLSPVFAPVDKGAREQAERARAHAVKPEANQHE